MDIEIKQICRNCGAILPELTVDVKCEIRLGWNEDDNQYEVTGETYDLNSVNEFDCPQCFTENIIVDQSIHLTDPDGKRSENSFNK
ncbi:MAG: hypothetical protein KAH48_10035 [Chlorobi bacterium]|nr:hypothetical protein [Chlorobiota bacterium]